MQTPLCLTFFWLLCIGFYIVPVCINGLRLGFSAFEVKYTICGIISFFTNMAFRGFCIETHHIYIYIKV